MKLKDLVGKKAIRIKSSYYQDVIDTSFTKHPIFVCSVDENRIQYKNCHVKKDGIAMIDNKVFNISTKIIDPIITDDNWDEWRHNSEDFKETIRVKK